MNKLFVFIDETYKLQGNNQFYCISGFITENKDIFLKEYLKILKNLKLAGREIKSNDKDAMRIRKKIAEKKLTDDIQIVMAYQEKNKIKDYKYFRNTIHEQEVILYQELFRILIESIMKAYGPKVDLILITEIDRNDKIKKDYFDQLKKAIVYEYQFSKIDFNVINSNISLGIQFADQICGINKGYIISGENKDIINKYFISIENPL